MKSLMNLICLQGTLRLCQAFGNKCRRLDTYGSAQSGRIGEGEEILLLLSYDLGYQESSKYQSWIQLRTLRFHFISCLYKETLS